MEDNKLSKFQINQITLRDELDEQQDDAMLVKESQLSILKFTKDAIASCEDDKFGDLINHVGEGLDQIGVDTSSKEAVVEGIDNLLDGIEEIDQEGLFTVMAVAAGISLVISILTVWLEYIFKTADEVYKEAQLYKKELQTKGVPLSKDALNDDGWLLTTHTEFIKQMNDLEGIAKDIGNMKEIDAKKLEVLVKRFEKLGLKWTGKKFSKKDPFIWKDQTMKQSGWHDNKAVMKGLDAVISLANSLYGIKEKMSGLKKMSKDSDQDPETKKSAKEAAKVLKAMFTVLISSLKKANDEMIGMANERIVEKRTP